MLRGQCAYGNLGALNGVYLFLVIKVISQGKSIIDWLPDPGLQASLYFLSRRALLLFSHEIDEVEEFVPTLTAKVMKLEEIRRHIIGFV